MCLPPCSSGQSGNRQIENVVVPSGLPQVGTSHKLMSFFVSIRQDRMPVASYKDRAVVIWDSFGILHAPPKNGLGFSTKNGLKLMNDTPGRRRSNGPRHEARDEHDDQQHTHDDKEIHQSFFLSVSSCI